MTTFVDSHCHVDRFDDPQQILADARRAGVVTVFVTEVPSQFQLLSTQLRGIDLVRLALGFHPLARTRDVALEMSLFARLLDRTDYIGEIGLDFSEQGRDTRTQQIDVFERILADRRVTTKVLTVHSRRAEKDTIERLVGAGVSAILHWYSGPLELIDRALDGGLYFSINPAMLRSRNGRQIVARLPRERVVTETDGPYTKVLGQPARPSDVPSLVAELATFWEIEAAEARELVFTSMSTLYASAKAAASA